MEPRPGRQELQQDRQGLRPGKYDLVVKLGDKESKPATFELEKDEATKAKEKKAAEEKKAKEEEKKKSEEKKTADSSSGEKDSNSP